MRALSNRVVWVILIPLLLGSLVGGQDKAATNNDKLAKAADAPFRHVPWTSFSVDYLKVIDAASKSVYVELGVRSPRIACGVAREYLRLVTKGVKAEDLKPEELEQLASDRVLWGVLCYLIERAEDAEGLNYAAAIWRHAIHLPEECPFELALIDLGGGELLARLFSSDDDPNRMSWIIAPLPEEELSVSQLEKFWDYFTAYGGDRKDHLVKLDMFATAFDLNPSYRAEWRNSESVQPLLKAFKETDLDFQWALANSAIDLRNGNLQRYLQIRDDYLAGKVELNEEMFAP